MTPSFDYANLDFISAPVFVLEVNEDGCPVYAAFNGHASQISGRPLADYLGRTAKQIYPGAYGRITYARHCEVMTSGVSTTYQIDLPIGGTTRTVRTTLRPQTDHRGAVVRLYGTSKDMTSEKRALEAKVEFDTLSTEMEQFVALAAHDLRAPMRQVAAISELLREDLQDSRPDTLEMLDLIENIALKSNDLIADVLSHAEIGRSGPVETIFSFPALCHDICDVIDPHGMHNITTSSATLEMDRTALQIALRNITENAIKHGGRPKLCIDISVQEGIPGMLDITLTDNGNGFSDGALKMMNANSFKVDSGYGLFGVKRLISARGGTLNARNLPGSAGAVVRFSLPGTCLGLPQIDPQSALASSAQAS